MVLDGREAHQLEVVAVQVAGGFDLDAAEVEAQDGGVASAHIPDVGAAEFQVVVKGGVPGMPVEQVVLVAEERRAGGGRRTEGAGDVGHRGVRCRAGTGQDTRRYPCDGVRCFHWGVDYTMVLFFLKEARKSRGVWPFLDLNMRLKLDWLLKPHSQQISEMLRVVSTSRRTAQASRTSMM